MKKILLAFSLFAFFSCSSDENTDENGFNPSSTLRENLSSITSSTKVLYSLYRSNPLSYEVGYFFANNGYVMNYKTVSDDWGNNGKNEKCVCPEFHKMYSLDDIVIIEDSENRFSWASIGTSSRTYSLEYINNKIQLKSSVGGLFSTWSVIADVQYEDYLNKESTYKNCHN